MKPSNYDKKKAEEVFDSGPWEYGESERATAISFLAQGMAIARAETREAANFAFVSSLQLLLAKDFGHAEDWHSAVSDLADSYKSLNEK